MELMILWCPTYIAGVPVDPSMVSEADTGYTIYQNANGRLMAAATGELTLVITVER